jgi:hypothetical protein
MAQHGYAFRRWQDVPEQLHALAIRLSSHQRQTGNVSTGPGQTRDYARFDWVAGKDHNRNISRCLLAANAQGT